MSLNFCEISRRRIETCIILEIISSLFLDFLEHLFFSDLPQTGFDDETFTDEIVRKRKEKQECRKYITLKRKVISLNRVFVVRDINDKNKIFFNWHFSAMLFEIVSQKGIIDLVRLTYPRVRNLSFPENFAYVINE